MSSLPEKLLRRILDPTCAIGEAENAACKLAQVCRRDGIDYARLVAILTGAAPPVAIPRRDDPFPQSGPRRPTGSDEVIPSGKYRGRTLWEVGQVDPMFLKWVATGWFGQRMTAFAENLMSYLESTR